MHYADDASFSRRPNPKDGKMRAVFESLRRNYQTKRRVRAVHVGGI
jgi:hypothetical protein